MKLHIQYLGIENRGILILIQTTVGITATIARIGINQAVLHEITVGKNQKALSNYYLLSLFQMILFLLIVIIFLKFNILVDINYQENLFALIIYLVTYFVYQTLFYFSFYLISIWKFSIINILFNGLNILFILLFESLRSLNGILVTIACSQFICSFILSIFLPKIRLVDLNKTTIKSLLSDGLNVFGWSLFKDLVYKIDILLFANRISPSEFGVYSVLRDLLYNVWKVTDPIISSLTKVYAEYNSNIREFMNYVKIYCIFSLLASPLIVFLIFYYLKYYLKIDVGDIFSKVYFMFFSFSVLFFVVWKAIASMYVISKINRPIYISLFVFFITLITLFNFTSELNSVFICMSISFLLTTLFLIYSFTKNNLTKPL